MLNLFSGASDHEGSPELDIISRKSAFVSYSQNPHCKLHLTDRYVLNPTTAEQDAIPLSQLFPPNTPTAALVEGPFSGLFPPIFDYRALAEKHSEERDFAAVTQEAREAAEKRDQAEERADVRDAATVH
jgi:hypothetical protein